MSLQSNNFLKFWDHYQTPTLGVSQYLLTTLKSLILNFPLPVSLLYPVERNDIEPVNCRKGCPSRYSRSLYNNMDGERWTDISVHLYDWDLVILNSLRLFPSTPGKIKKKKNQNKVQDRHERTVQVKRVDGNRKKEEKLEPELVISEFCVKW